jgi:hypothetical protein
MKQYSTYLEVKGDLCTVEARGQAMQWQREVNKKQVDRNENI